MKEAIKSFLTKHIVPYVFSLTHQKLLFRELLKANKAYDDGLTLEGNIPGFRLKIGRAYLVFIIGLHTALIPLVAIFHKWLAKIDCHALIVLSVVLTWVFFVSFSIFRTLLVDLVAKKIITQAWGIHFPHFDYEKYHKLVSRLYGEAVEKELPKKELELFIINGIVTEK